ncbi:hypothetical protein C8J57DRAFT_251018 [Mycena rebaudengoi]|nr:hypothetical protein C8J57DRAFT_251018 [Mycena rebaudengoi]
MDPVASVASSERSVTQDPKYFFNDGDCVFRVDGVLFKLHKLILYRDPGSMFRDMFNIPQGNIRDAEPIPLQDTAEEFRALCWVIYALPDETQSQNAREVDIPRLVSVAKMSHKYTLPSFESWALDIIWIHCQPGMDYLDSCSQDMLEVIFEAAFAGGHSDLRRLVERKWLSRLKSGELKLRHALDFGEQHERRWFLGEAYYQQVQDMKSIAPTPSATADYSHLNLTPAQLHRLVFGYCSLSMFWSTIGQHDVPRQSNCARSHEVWSNIPFSTFLLSNGPPDVRKGLGAMKKSLSYCNCPCSRAHVDKLIDIFTKSVADHFLGVETRSEDGEVHNSSN